MKKSFIAIVAILVAAFLQPALAWDGSVSGTIASIHVADPSASPAGQSFRIVLTGTPVMCTGGSTYAYINTTDSNYQTFTALLTLARSQAFSVVVYTTAVGGYCHIGYVGPILKTSRTIQERPLDGGHYQKGVCMKALFLAFALVCSQAMADGVLLATPAPSLALTDPVMIEYAKNPAVVSVKAIHVDRNAMHSNVIRLNVEGKERTFVGGMKPIELTRIPCWAGKEPSAPHQPVNLLVLCTDATGYLGGTVTTMTRTYDFVVKGGHELLVEKDTLHNVHPDTAPEMRLPPGAKQ